MNDSRNEAPAPFQVVNHRVDAVTLAYRVTFPRTLLDALVERSNVAKRHGRALFAFGDVQGEMRYSRADHAWLVLCPRFRCRFLLHAPGATRDNEPGWTFEIIWSAAALAVMTPRRVRLASHRIARSCGQVFGSRLRRLDLCADIAGWKVAHEDVEKFVRRPGASLNSYALTDEDAIRLEDHGEASPELSTERIVTHYRTNVTGFSFCIGSPMMARCYDKLAELALKREDLREPELERFRANGWDGVTPVTRVEFQIRGEALRDFGLRDPDAPTQDERLDGRLVTVSRFDGFEAVLGRVWKRCVSWLRLSTKRRDDAEHARDMPTDPRWAMLRGLVFDVAAVEGEHKRVRRRGGASVGQTLGCALSTLGQAGRLRKWLPGLVRATARDAALTGALVHHIFNEAATVVVDGLLNVFGPVEAYEHIVEVNNACWGREFDGQQGAPAWDDRAAPLARAG